MFGLVRLVKSIGVDFENATEKGILGFNLIKVELGQLAKREVVVSKCELDVLDAGFLDGESIDGDKEEEGDQQTQKERVREAGDGHGVNPCRDGSPKHQQEKTI